MAERRLTERTAGDACACGAVKQPQYHFCPHCYLRLPYQFRRDMRIGPSPIVVERARQWLSNNPACPGSSKTS